MENVILYSNGCPKCQVIESKLKAKNINYTVSNDLEELYSFGFSSLPVVSAFGKFMNFPEANRWVNEQETR